MQILRDREWKYFLCLVTSYNSTLNKTLSGLDKLLKVLRMHIELIFLRLPLLKLYIEYAEIAYRMIGHEIRHFLSNMRHALQFTNWYNWVG